MTHKHSRCRRHNIVLHQAHGQLPPLASQCNTACCMYCDYESPAAVYSDSHNISHAVGVSRHVMHMYMHVVGCNSQRSALACSPKYLATAAAAGQIHGRQLLQCSLMLMRQLGWLKVLKRCSLIEPWKIQSCFPLTVDRSITHQYTLDVPLVRVDPHFLTDILGHEPAACAYDHNRAHASHCDMSSEASEHGVSPPNPFANFELEKVLSESDRTKYMALLGRYVVCPARHARVSSTPVPEPIAGGMVSQTRGSYCFPGGHSTLRRFNTCWPPAPVLSCNFRTIYMRKYAKRP